MAIKNFKWDGTINHAKSLIRNFKLPAFIDKDSNFYIIDKDEKIIIKKNQILEVKRTKGNITIKIK